MEEENFKVKIEKKKFKKKFKKKKEFKKKKKVDTRVCMNTFMSKKCN